MRSTLKSQSCLGLEEIELEHLCEKIVEGEESLAILTLRLLCDESLAPVAMMENRCYWSKTGTC